MHTQPVQVTDWSKGRTNTRVASTGMIANHRELIVIMQNGEHLTDPIQALRLFLLRSTVGPKRCWRTLVGDAPHWRKPTTGGRVGEKYLVPVMYRNFDNSRIGDAGLARFMPSRLQICTGLLQFPLSISPDGALK